MTDGILAKRGRLVWLAEVPWLGLTQRHHHLVRHLKRDWDILFVEPPASLRGPRLSTSRVEGIRVAQVMPIANARPRFARWALSHRWLQRLSGRLMAAQVLVHVGRLGWLRHGEPDLVAVCSNVYFAEAMRTLQPRLAILDLADDPRHFPDEPAWVGELLMQAVREADLVTTSSRVLLDEVTSAGVAHSSYIPNGVRQDLLKAGVVGRPQKGPVGYLGYIGLWLDFELLEQLASGLPQTTIQLVGPMAPSVAPALDRLLRHDNVRHVGAVAQETVGGVLAHFGVGIIPFRLTPLTRAVNPNKLYEYAAFDLPIVTTPFSPEVCELSETIDVCLNADAFIRAVEGHITGGPRTSTRPIAEAHSWDAIGNQFAALLQ